MTGPMPFEVRSARPDDVATIAEYNRAMALETEHLELDLGRLEKGVRAVLDDSAKGFYLVADDGGETAGQLLITFEWSDWRNAVFWWIQSVYVRPESRGRGVYKALYAAALERAQAAGDVCGLRLYVEKENDRAKSAYRKAGMRQAVYDMFEVDFVIER